MDIYSRIMHYITVYSGSKNEVVKNTVEDGIRDYTFSSKQKGSEAVERSIDFLLSKGFLKIVKENELTPVERTYPYINNTILRIMIPWSKEKLDEIMELENSNIKESFLKEFGKLTKWSKFSHTGYVEDFKLIIDNDLNLVIEQDSNHLTYELNLKETSNWYYDPSDHYLYFKKDGFEHFMQQSCWDGKINVVGPKNFYVEF